MSVSGSPVTGSGTLTGTLTTQAINRIFAGPSSGAAAAPTFRALATADIPSLSYVSSVGATAPITSTGGLTPTIGVTAAALNKTDDTNVTMTLSGSPSTALIAATTMALGWTGQLAVSRGGTGAALTTANFVFAGPTSGAPAAPTFRALTTADLSSLGYVTSVSGTTGRITSTGGTAPIIDLASGVIAAGTTGSVTAIPVITVDTYGRVTSITTAANPQGTVTSVGLSLPSIMSVSGSPVTSSGTLTGTLTTQAVNAIFAGPSSGAAASPTFRALATADIPALSYVSSVSGTTGRITSTGGLTPVIDLASGVIAAGTTGSVTAIPVITVDTYGRVTSITTAANPQGTVTSVTGTSPVVSSGGATPAISLATAYGDTLNPYASKTANYFLGAPNGSAGVPTFRALATADIPALAYVTSVALSLPSIMTVSGSPVTSSGTLTGTLTTQTVNAIFAGPSSGSAAAPTFRSLTTADIPTLNQNTTGTASNVTGVVAIVNGGTGQTTANTAFNALAPSQTTNSGKYLTTNGTDTSWATVGSSSNTSAFAFAWFIR
jgi:hypothetical protein